MADEQSINNLEQDSLETPENGPVSSPDDKDKSDDPKNPPKSKQKTSLSKKVRALIGRLNIYLLLFVLIVVLVVGFTLISIQKNKKDAQPSSVSTQSLTQDEINKLSGTDSSVGDAKQTLTIASNAIFAGKVLIRDSLDIAGGLKIGGPLNLPGLTVSGTATFDQIQANKLTVSGDTNIQGQLTALKGITVTGGGSFGGPISAPQINVQNFQLSGDLQLQRHIDAGGNTPTKTDGNKLGSGGTTSVGGTDTAGTVNINLGSSPLAGDGCFVTIHFAQPFNATPHVTLTPVGANAAGLNYYVSRNTNSFQICATNTSTGSLAFDYIAVD